MLRRPWLSLCSLVMSLVLCLLIGYLFVYRVEQSRQLVQVQQSQKVLCVVANEKGTASQGLQMDNSYVNLALSDTSPLAPYMRDLRITKEFLYSSPMLHVPQTFGRDDTPMLGVNSPRCSDRLNPEMGAQVTYLEPDFYERSDYVCLVSEANYYKLDGAPLEFHVTDPFIASKEASGIGKGEITLTVVGYYAGMGQEVFLPFGTAMAIATEISFCRSCDSIAFLASDNLRLEELAQTASDYFTVVDPSAPMTSKPQYALTIRDEQYRATVTVLEQNIQRSNLLLPLLLLLGAGVGFLASFLSTRNESKTYALMRTLGVTRRKLFFSVLREQFSPAVLAAAVVLPIFRAWAPIAIYLGCYLVGCVACITRTIRVSPTAILREQE